MYSRRAVPSRGGNARSRTARARSWKRVIKASTSKPSAIRGTVARHGGVGGRIVGSRKPNREERGGREERSTSALRRGSGPQAQHRDSCRALPRVRCRPRGRPRVLVPGGRRRRRRRGKRALVSEL